MDSTKTNDMTCTPDISRSLLAATAHSAFTAPKTREQGTAVPAATYAAWVLPSFGPAAGTAVRTAVRTAPNAQVAVAGARLTDLSGLRLRGAPV